jgi:APA family basic amino acid/polyamine antiporter
LTGATAPGPALVRSLGRWTITGLVLNSIIGTGVFVLPGTVAAMLGWYGLLAWVLAAGCTAAMMLCFGEVASRFSSAGGAYLYTKEAFGGFAGLQIGWMTYFVRAISAAVQANLFSVSLAQFWPWAGTRAGGIAVTTVFVGLLAAINVRGVTSGARVSNAFAVVKILPLLLFGLAGLFWIAKGQGAPPIIASDASLGGWLQVMLLLMFAYGGFESALIPLGEARDPRRDAAPAMLGGLAVVTLVYLAAQLTVLATVADPGATQRPLAASALVMLGAGGATAITIAAMVSVYGWMASNMLNVPRLTMAMAERGELPSLFARLHPRFRTPWVSILLFAGLSWVLANQAGLLQNLSLSAVSRLFVYGFVCAALPVFRVRERRADSGRAPAPALFRAPLGNLMAAFSVGLAMLLATRITGREVLPLVITVAVAAAHWATVRRRAIYSRP